ncbi:GNAT family N-acetyltransferase [Aestuariispira ectoiniformans]|uniref:GNAT family N-acetyltransferase n=1 Tax=Aestuariispira ectoiniformans TaxID=2775080 RepID=UPI00223C285D|nr:GNAT family N-acetyltransferase [Aestuariispira ectoiniformans]
MNIEIVEAGPNDADLVSIMVYQLLQELYRGESPVSDEEVYETCHQLFDDEDPRFSALLGFDENRRPLAVMTITEAVALFAKGRYGLITEFFVDPVHRSRGVGEKMISHASEMGRRRGWSCLELNTPGGDEGTRAVNFYLREGFRNIGPTLKLRL